MTTPLPAATLFALPPRNNMSPDFLCLISSTRHTDARPGLPCGLLIQRTGPRTVSQTSGLFAFDPLLIYLLGEIDVVEAVEQGNTGAQSTLHTKENCKMNVERKQYGSVTGTNCWNGTDDNAGCGVQGGNETYGKAFNDNGGGVSTFFALHSWTLSDGEIRYMQWSGAMQVFASGSSTAQTSLETLPPATTRRLIRQHGECLLQTSPALIAASATTLRISQSLQTLVRKLKVQSPCADSCIMSGSIEIPLRWCLNLVRLADA